MTVTEPDADTGERDWRESAYLRKANWPDAIPPMGPRREYGPYPWGEPTDPDGVDEYPRSHVDAASVGHLYMGDVCPMCGVPLAADEVVVSRHGTRGELHVVSPDHDQVACYHPDCYREREATIASRYNASLEADK